MKKYLLLTVSFCLICLSAYAGQLKIASTLPQEITQIITQRFSSQTGIETQIFYLGENEFNAKLNLIYQKDIDCILGLNSEYFYQANRLKLLTPYLAKELYKVPAFFRAPEAAWTNLYVEHIGFLSNADTLRNLGLYAPDTWIELLNPNFRHKLSISNYESGGIGFSSVVALWQLKGKTSALDYARGFNRQQCLLLSDGEDPVPSLLSGQIATAIVPLHTALAMEEKYPELYATVVHDANRNILRGVAIMRGTANLDNSQKFIDFLMSDDCIDYCKEKDLQSPWHVKTYLRDPQRRLVTGIIATSHDDLHWIVTEKRDIIKQWLQQ